MEAMCECGCGQPTTIPTSTNRKIGRIKGVPMRYLPGHNARGQVLRQGPDWLPEDRGWLTPCHIWQHHKTKGGYGRATDPKQPGRQEYAHRLAWEAANGQIPEGLEIDHLCRQRDCVNPAHLEPVTSRVNGLRGDAGLASGAQQRAKTHCPKGHPYSGENLYVDATGRRHCKTCRREQLRKSRARRAAV
jgi:hypothetical protein